MIPYKSHFTEADNSSEKEYRKMVKDVGLGFHPDTPFEDYVNTETGKPTYTPEEAKEKNKELQKYRKEFGDRIYDIGMEEFRKHPLFKKSR